MTDVVHIDDTSYLSDNTYPGASTLMASVPTIPALPNPNSISTTDPVTVPSSISPTVASTVVSRADREAFLSTLAVTPAQIAEYEALDQRSDAWHAVRKNRIGGSTAGAVAGHDKYKTPSRALRDMLWGGFSESWQSQKGTVMEDTAFAIAHHAIREQLLAEGYRHAWLEPTGILVDAAKPWLAVSSDGKVFATGHADKKRPSGFIGVIEIKVPGNDEPYPEPKHVHFDQFTMTCALHGVARIWYVIYTSQATSFYHYDLDTKYWTTQLLPALQRFYMGEFLDRVILRDRGALEPGCVDLKIAIPPHPVSRRLVVPPSGFADEEHKPVIPAAFLEWKKRKQF